MRIAGREIGPGQPPYIVAEISCNHNSQLSRALELINIAQECGADAVKVQCYTADTMTIQDGYEIKDGPWQGQNLYQLYERSSTPMSWFPALFDHAKQRNITLFSSVYDTTALDYLETLDCPAYKIASYEITDIPLIHHVAKTGKPLIISTGMASGDEISAVETALRNLATIMYPQPVEYLFLHCVSGYPTPLRESNLWVIKENGWGLSDHSMAIEVPIAAVALGAPMIEKHLCYTEYDPEEAFSLRPFQFYRMAEGCKNAWRAMQECPTSSEKPQHQLRRSLHAVTDIEPGEHLSLENIKSLRPNGGMYPGQLPFLIGQPAKRKIMRGEPITNDCVEERHDAR